MDRQLDAMDKQVEKQRLEREKEAAAIEEKARKSLLVKMILWYYAFQVIAIVLMCVGMFTNAWFEFNGSDEARGPNQREENIVEFNQHWGMSFISMSIFAEFCDQKYGGCASVRDQTINYNVVRNDVSSQWPVHYHPALEEILEGQSAAMGCWLTWFFGAMFGGYVFLATLMWRNGRRRTIMFTNVGVQVVSASLGFVGIVIFADGTKSLRDQLAVDSVFEDPMLARSRPDMSLSWSCFLCLIAVGLSAASIAPILIATFRMEDRIRGNVKIDNVRDKRIKQYFRDLTNSSHQKEKHPMDDCATMASMKVRKAGWTTQVRSEPVNKMMIYDLDQDERLGTAIAEYNPMDNLDNLGPTAAKYMPAQPAVQDQLATQFGKTCAFKLDQGKVQAGIAAKQKQEADIKALEEQLHPNRKKKVDPNAKRTLPRQQRTVIEESVPGMIQEIKYVERDRKVTRAPLPPKRLRPGEKVTEEINIA